MGPGHPPPGPPRPDGRGPWGPPPDDRPEELARTRSSDFYADVGEVLGLQARLLAEAGDKAREKGAPEPVTRFLGVYGSLRTTQQEWIGKLSALRARAPGSADFEAGLAALGAVPWAAVAPVLAEGSELLRRQWDQEIGPLVGALPGAPGLPTAATATTTATTGPGEGPAREADEDLTGLVLGLFGVLAVAIGMLAWPRRAPREEPFAVFVEGLVRLAFGDLHTLKNRAGIAPGDPGLAEGRKRAGDALAGLVPPPELAEARARLGEIGAALVAPGGEARAHQLAGDLLRGLEVPVFDVLDRLVGRFCRDRTVELRPGLPGPAAYAREPARAVADLELMVGNLVDNAFQAGARTVRIEVEGVGPEAAGTRVRVVDDGPGFAPADRERALVAAFAERGPGRGTGLTTVARTGRARGWAVGLAAGTPTTFEILIPGGPEGRPGG